VHALVGENGAGKSTLMKILTGMNSPDRGSIIIDGVSHASLTIQSAKQLGISMIYQELNNILTLTICENIFLGREIIRGGLLARKAMVAEADRLLREFELDISSTLKMAEVTVAYQQLVEIVKAVSTNARILIMDEPTAPLSIDEVEMLYRLVRKLKQAGVSIIYISHRLEEIFEIADRITVFRDGRYIATHPVAETDEATLIREMVGRELVNYYPPRVEMPLGPALLEARNLTTAAIRSASFRLRQGEILGIGGLIGSGRTELLRAVFGADHIASGEVLIDSQRVEIKTPRDGIGEGIALIPEDRKQHGLLLKMSVRDNVIFASLRKFVSGFLLSPDRVKRAVDGAITKLGIKTPGPRQLVKLLSGGNQQKVVLAKWIESNAKVFLFDEPTRGIDVGARHEIYELMNTLKEAGKGIIMVSSDMQELIGMSDRILVMKDGRIAGELDQSEITQENIMRLASV
jgi:ribose transport system ATP-binding protein